MIQDLSLFEYSAQQASNAMRAACDVGTLRLQSDDFITISCLDGQPFLLLSLTFEVRSVSEIQIDLVGSGMPTIDVSLSETINGF